MGAGNSRGVREVQDLASEGLWFGSVGSNSRACVNVTLRAALP